MRIVKSTEIVSLAHQFSRQLSLLTIEIYCYQLVVKRRSARHHDAWLENPTLKDDLDLDSICFF